MIGARGSRFVARRRMACGLLLLGLAAAPVTSQSVSDRRAPGPASRAPEDAKTSALQHGLERKLQAMADSADGVMGYEIVDLTSGARFGRLQSEVFPAASTIKLAILYELFRQADEGKVKLDELRPLERRHVVGGAGVLRELTSPSMPLRDYATLMIALSDNTAANLIIESVGMGNVTARMAGLGLKATRLRRRMMDLEAARRGDENVSSPSEIARLLEILHRGDGLTRDAHRGLLEILETPKSSPMRRSVPSAVDVANKPGTLEGVAVDAGIVYVPGRPYVFSAMLTYLKDGAAGDATIESASRAVYDHFSRLAAASEYGRAIR